MKTSIYNKADHTEGYIETGSDNGVKSDVQKAYETQNDTNEVTAFGKEPSELIEGNRKAKDGLDNSGTQGKDSLSDDSYTNTGKNATVESAASGTGSAGKDFKTEGSINEQDENHALNTGI
ncbi:hypothetical protein [Pedobacter endophyticus]|uniref:Uncharacterized protein n=1 Tax=Pedobacter endophyticus TaxID=2789740 RepID=A0A7S9Q0X5_9SPHI|nr:hypothetical protein [Pedobacter endophyticus]QPH41435.1 hypothetical protein IZT61_09330 [Pedobacter endophyticus]